MRAAHTLTACGLLALTLAACDSEHPAVEHAKLEAEFGPSRFITIPPEYREDREAYIEVGRKFCPSGQICTAIFFPQGTEIQIPPTGEMMAVRYGEYSVNPLTGQMNLHLRCDFAAADQNNCF